MSFSIPIPTPSYDAKQGIMALNRHVARIFYKGSPLHVCFRPWEDVNWTENGSRIGDDTVLIERDDSWILQSADMTIDESLSAILGVAPHTLIISEPFRMAPKYDGWVGQPMEDADNMYKKRWADIWEGMTHVQRIDFSLSVDSSIQSAEDRPPILLATSGRRLKDSVIRYQNMRLNVNYEHYLNRYRSVLADPYSMARERNYYREKALAAADDEDVYQVDPILRSPLAMEDSEISEAAVGTLEEDWEYC